MNAIEAYKKKIVSNITSSLFLLFYIILLLWVVWLFVINFFDEFNLKYMGGLVLWIIALLMRITNNYRNIFLENYFKEGLEKTDKLLPKVWKRENTIPELVVMAVISIPIMVLVAIFIFSGELSKNYIFTEKGESLNYYCNIFSASFVIFNFNDAPKTFYIKYKIWIKLFYFLTFIFFIIAMFLNFFATTQIVEITM